MDLNRHRLKILLEQNDYPEGSTSWNHLELRLSLLTLYREICLAICRLFETFKFIPNSGKVLTYKYKKRRINNENMDPQ